MTKYVSAHYPRTAQRVPSVYGPDPANPGDHRHPQAQPSLLMSSRVGCWYSTSMSAACACSRRCLRNTCAKRTIHRSGKRRKEVRARSVCVYEVERVGSHCLRTSPKCLSSHCFQHCSDGRGCTAAARGPRWYHRASSPCGSCPNAAPVESAVAAPRQHFLQTNACLCQDSQLPAPMGPQA